MPSSLKTSLRISIHALLAESDTEKEKETARGHNFYPRSPCGERPACDNVVVCSVIISIHALLAESDEDFTVITE